MDCATRHPAGVIGYITGELSRFSRHHRCMHKLQLPPGTDCAWQEGSKFAAGRNIVTRSFLDDFPDAAWLFWMDDDHTFRRNTLLKLLDHDVDIVQPLVVTRKPPYFPYAYDRKPEPPGYTSKDFDKLGRPGLLEVDTSACGGMLVKRHVIEAIAEANPEDPYPWFKEGRSGEGPGEDFYFCEQAKKLGFKCHIATDVTMGHIIIADAWPEWLEDPDHPEGGRWVVALVMDHGLALRVEPNFGRQALGVPPCK